MVVKTEFWNFGALQIKTMIYRETPWGRYLRRRLYQTSQKVHQRYQRLLLTAQRPRKFVEVLAQGDQVQLAFIVLTLIVVGGTVGYMAIMGWSMVDALYMTVIALTTVGFGEVSPLSPEGRLFTIFLLVAGISIIAYGISGAVEDVISGRLLMRLQERQKAMVLQSLKDHYIVVGFGRVGQEVAFAFYHEKIPFVVVDNDDEAIRKATELGYLAIQGSATEDDTLEAAAIRQAKGLVSAAGDNATNIYVVLSARGLNENLFIIARTTDDLAAVKIQRAGANRVISPYILSGRRMANLALRPYVVDFLDITSQSNLIEQALEEVVIEANSVLAGKTIGEVNLRRRTGANILALYRLNGELLSNPTSTTILEPGTRLILLGTRDQLDVTEALARDFMKLIEAEKE